MMSLLKISRIRWSPGKEDSWMDLAGYAACGWHCVAPTPQAAAVDMDVLLAAHEAAR